MSNLYGTEIEIWAGFGPVGNTEKKIWADYEQLLRLFFINQKVIFPQKLLIISLIFISILPTGPKPAQISISVQ